ncbi:MAG: DUF4230 domain-containing protein [Solirubrobacteraceae bacterium]
MLSLVLGVVWIKGVLPDWHNPFASRTVDRTHEPVLMVVRDIGEYRAAGGEYQVIVDLEKDTGLPSEVLGTRTLFVAVGSVDAGVDLSTLDEDAVTVSDDGRSVSIVLPHARLYDPELDLGRSYPFDRDEGLLNRIGGVFTGGDDDWQREAMLAGEARIAEAAAGSGELVSRAEENTATMLETLVKSLGFARVDVRFE